MSSHNDGNRKGRNRMDKFLGKHPQFSGDENILGFFRSSGKWCKAQCIDKDFKATILASALIGDDRDYTYNLLHIEDMYREKMLRITQINCHIWRKWIVLPSRHHCCRTMPVRLTNT